MIEVLHFIFQDFEHFAGVVILLGVFRPVCIDRSVNHYKDGEKR